MITTKITERTVRDTVYVTSDGQEFPSERRAQRHEHEIAPSRNLDHFGIWMPMDEAYATCYRVTNEEDFEYLHFKEWNGNIWGNYEGPGWYVGVWHDGGDSEDWYEVYNLEAYTQKLESHLQEIRESLEEFNT